MTIYQVQLSISAIEDHEHYKMPPEPFMSWYFLNKEKAFSKFISEIPNYSNKEDAGKILEQCGEFKDCEKSFWATWFYDKKCEATIETYCVEMALIILETEDEME